MILYLLSNKFSKDRMILESKVDHLHM